MFSRILQENEEASNEGDHPENPMNSIGQLTDDNIRIISQQELCAWWEQYSEEEKEIRYEEQPPECWGFGHIGKSEILYMIVVVICVTFGQGAGFPATDILKTWALVLLCHLTPRGVSRFTSFRVTRLMLRANLEN